MRPAAVTFDLFGTLVDFSIERDERPLVAELLDEADGTADPGTVLATWLEASLAERGRTPFRTVRIAIEHGARVTRDEHDLAIEPSYWASALETLWATRPLREDAQAAIARIEHAGLPWAIVSNVDEPVLKALLRRTGLAGRAHAVVSSEQARAYKPHPRPFRMALRRLGVEPDEACTWATIRARIEQAPERPAWRPGWSARRAWRPSSTSSWVSRRRRRRVAARRRGPSGCA